MTDHVHDQVVPPSPQNIQGSNSSKRPTSAMIAFVMFVLGLGVGGVGIYPFLPSSTPEPAKRWDKDNKEPTNSLKLSKEKQQAIGIETTVIQKRMLPSYAWRTGRIALHEDRIAHISAPVEGIVRESPVRLGQTVTAGQTLAVLESRELGQAKLEAYKARKQLDAEREVANRVKTAMKNTEYLIKLLEQETSLADIEQKLKDRPIGEWRQQLLSAYAKRKQLKAELASQRASTGTVSGVAVMKTEAELDAANASFTALLEELRFQVKNQTRQAELRLADAEMQLEIARAKLVIFGLERNEVDRLDRIEDSSEISALKIKAPFTGTVVEKHAVRSERVGPQTQMFVLADLTSVWVQTDLFEADLSLLRNLTDPTVIFRAPLSGISTQTATITYTGDLIDKSSRALTLIAEAPNPQRELKPGMYVEVGFKAGADQPHYYVPVSAILRQEDKAFVFVQSGEEDFQQIEVTLGRVIEEEVEILSGLSPGSRIVTKGGFILKSELLKDQMVGE
ncbi:MAG: efflux RND transporter periplasmic adaptor subunit [Gemmataceae bacterium]